MGFLIACFVVGLVVIMLFTEGGRDCLTGIFGLAFGLIAITVLGGLVIFFLISLL